MLEKQWGRSHVESTLAAAEQSLSGTKLSSVQWVTPDAGLDYVVSWVHPGLSFLISLGTRTMEQKSK